MYNGYKNYETWNVALWINNDQGLYDMSMDYRNYESFSRALIENNEFQTPDGVKYDDKNLDFSELDRVIEGE